MPEKSSPKKPSPGRSDQGGVSFLGIDVGGTEVKLGVVGQDGVIQRRTRASTPELGLPGKVFEFARQFAKEESRGGKTIHGVGLAVPGVLDTKQIVLREVVNLPGWLGVPLLEELQSLFDVPATVVNDANAAAYAEHDLRGLEDKSLALLTLGTGVGCGLVLRGSPFGGDHGCAGELGHIAIDFSEDALPCTCGSRGHLESYAGAAGVVQRTKTAMQRSGQPMSDSMTPRDIAAMAESGDFVCEQVIRQTADYIGRAIGMLGQAVDPEVVLLGGAMTFGGKATDTGRAFLDSVRRSVQQTTLVQVGGNIKIEFADLGNDAGMIGAAMVAKSIGASHSSTSAD